VKTRYFIFLSYKGTAYHGWQLQPSSVTVQKIIDSALSVILGEEISTIGAGRTDTGVHARFFCAHFESIRDDLHTREKLIFRMNRYLPADIAVKAVRRVLPDANARYSAISRTYRYYVSRVKDPFCNEYSWFLHGNIDIRAMNEACQVLFEHSDFTSFSRLHSGARTNICRIYEAYWTEEGTMLVFTVRADRFLRNMVRAIVGTLTELGFGKLDKKAFEAVIDAKDRCRAKTSAPARGLFLEAIEYPDEIYIKDVNGL
jgi:tRNA pseudouridine38-40 synthase